MLTGLSSCGCMPHPLGLMFTNGTVPRHAWLCMRKGGEHSALFACKVLTRTFGNAFGSSATTGGLHFLWCILFSVHLFFWISSKNFRPTETLTPKIEKEVKMGEKKYFEPVVLCSYTIGTPGHLCLLQLVPIWLRSEP
jgi:hypothetical protein